MNARIQNICLAIAISMSTIACYSYCDTDWYPIILMDALSPCTIDFAIKRQGRMKTPIEISLPSFKDRKEFFMREIRGLASPGAIDFDRLSNLTEGQTRQALLDIVNAASSAHVVNNTPLTQELLEQIIDRVINSDPA